MAKIILLSSGFVLNAKTRMKLMTGLKMKLQNARSTNVVINAQRLKTS